MMTQSGEEVMEFRDQNKITKQVCKRHAREEINWRGLVRNVAETENQERTLGERSKWRKAHPQHTIHLRHSYNPQHP